MVDSAETARPTLSISVEGAWQNSTTKETVSIIQKRQEQGSHLREGKEAAMAPPGAATLTAILKGHVGLHQQVGVPAARS